MNTIEIKNLLDSSPSCKLPELLKEFEDDDRKSVKNIVSVYRNKYSLYLSEVERMDKMYLYEKKYYETGCKYIAGMDEVGRGPLAGPVVAAAVILPKDFDVLYINDSKQLSESRREKLYPEIRDKALAVGTGIVPPDIIDEINIRQATILAMRKALEDLSIIPDAVLIDGDLLPDINIKKQERIIKGDTKSVSIAAASIIAKVIRDEMMRGYDIEYPQYDFAVNKGYGTLKHRTAIEKFGICLIHRKSFTTESRNKTSKKDTVTQNQISLFEYN